ncbi:MAG TPA: glycosyltransferase family 4 protein [Verrucomicrobiae bacterium]|jgi:glycosyltransferase involved in cell wall biosynthesis|nr:glycosyltransferase family 4 protein [Verrucomicrobiae bacterium]
MKRVRVLLLAHDFSLSGAPRSAAEIFEDLAGDVDLRVLSLAGGPLRRRYENLGPVKLLLALPKGDSLKRRLTRKLIRAWEQAQLNAWLFSWKPEIIYVNTTAALRIVERLDLPKARVILHVRELSAVLRNTKCDQDVLARYPTHYIAASTAVRDMLVREHSISADKIDVVLSYMPRGEEFEKYTVKKDLSKRPWVIGGAGHPRWWKGGVLWLQMARELLDILGKGNVRFSWVGAARDEHGTGFREIAGKLGLYESVDILPPVENPLEHYARFHVFALTSWEDACSRVVSENMSLGNPVFCFKDGGGAPDLAGDTNAAVDSFSPQAMAKSIAALLKDEARYHRVSAAARSRAKTEFTSFNQAGKILRIMQRLLSGSGQGMSAVPDSLGTAVEAYPFPPAAKTGSF